MTFRRILNAIRYYCQIFEDRLRGYKVPRLDHDYEGFFRVGKGDVVVDVGANIGLFTISVAKRAARIVAIEPEPANFKLLVENVKRRKLSNVLLVQKAVWKSKQLMPLFLAPASQAHSLINGNQRLESKLPLTVEADTIDGIMKDLNVNRVDFVKIDVEGAEMEALKEAGETLKKASKVVVASYHLRYGQSTVKYVAQYLKKHGFRVHVTPDELVYGFHTMAKFGHPYKELC